LALILTAVDAMTKGMVDAPSVTDVSLSAAVTGDLLSKIAPLLEHINPQSRKQALDVRGRITQALNSF